MSSKYISRYHKDAPLPNPQNKQLTGISHPLPCLYVSPSSLLQVRTSRASVSGISTLRRVGDVKVVNRKGAKEIRTQFVLGPVDLRVARKVRKGMGKVLQVRDEKGS